MLSLDFDLSQSLIRGSQRDLFRAIHTIRGRDARVQAEIVIRPAS
jgi:hypothetical protein